MTTHEHPNREDVMAWLDGEMSVERGTELRAHIANCSVCQALVEDLQSVSRQVHEWRVDAPPASFDGRVAGPRRAIAGAPVVGTAGTKSGWATGFAWTQRFGWQIAAVVVVGVAGGVWAISGPATVLRFGVPPPPAQGSYALTIPENADGAQGRQRPSDPARPGETQPAPIARPSVLVGRPVEATPKSSIGPPALPRPVDHRAGTLPVQPLPVTPPPQQGQTAETQFRASARVMTTGAVGGVAGAAAGGGAGRGGGAGGRGSQAGQAPPPPPAPPPPLPATVKPVTADRMMQMTETVTVVQVMIARTASMRIVVSDIDQARGTLERYLLANGGLVTRLNLTGERPQPRALEATVKVPTRSLAAALLAFRALGRVQSESQGSEDVTSQSIDLDARLANARRTEQRLAALIQQRTGTVRDVLEAEREIARVRGEIERMEAERAQLASRVDMATIDLRLTEERRAELGPETTSVWRDLSNASRDGLRTSAEFALGTVTLFLRLGPTVLICVTAVGLPTALWRHRRRPRPVL